MPPVVSITDFRKNIFDYTDELLLRGGELAVMKNGKTVFRVSPVKDDPAEKARYFLEYLAPKLAGVWKNVPQEEFDRTNEFVRGKKEKAYIKRLGKWTYGDKKGSR